MIDGVDISTDPARLDVDLVHRVLADSYWARGRTRDVVLRSIANSVPFGAYRDGRQIGFGRVVTDRAVFAYIADVFVVPHERGRGVGKALVQAMVTHPDVASLKVMLLRTRDAHGLYEPFGFRALPNPGEMMGRYSD